MSNSNNGKQTDGVNLIFVEQQKTYLRKEAINQSKGSLAQKLESIKQNGFRLSVFDDYENKESVDLCRDFIGTSRLFCSCFAVWLVLLFFLASVLLLHFLSITIHCSTIVARWVALVLLPNNHRSQTIETPRDFCFLDFAAP